MCRDCLSASPTFGRSFGPKEQKFEQEISARGKGTEASVDAPKQDAVSNGWGVR